MHRNIQIHRVPGGDLPGNATIDWIDDYRSLVLPEDGETDPVCGECVGWAILVTRLAQRLGVVLSSGEIPMFGAHPTETDTWVFWTLATRSDPDGAMKVSPANAPALANETNRYEAGISISLWLTEGAA
jgi:hypothetical protein